MNRIRFPLLGRATFWLAFTVAVCWSTLSFGAQVIAPDNGGGTATMPPAGEYYLGDLMQIINGLPPGTTVDMTAPLWGNFAAITEAAGGALGGTASTYNSEFVWQLVGTGALLGYNRPITLTLANGAQAQMDSSPRTAFAPVQNFTGDVFALFGQLPPGDPDFDLLRVTAGSTFGMPSPGQTILTDLGGGNWNVDSFFDITYRIDFVGHPGGPFGGMSGSTTSTAHFVLGIPVPEPSTIALAAMGGAAVALAIARRRAATR